ncbi:hypothetical protein LCGC14_2663210 [marine sediment metagenome]|uniref:Uncharacterized protein n=1 Tax=marine sediment metagenome TaxID=412755 RepID=A0A0F8ZRA5_9ZZZZ
MTQPKTASKFTPGPWKVVSTPITWQIRDATDEVITESWDYHPLPDANARLIAAAPEMYELLSSLADQADYALTQGDVPKYARNPLLHCIRESRQLKAAIDGEG